MKKPDDGESAACFLPVSVQLRSNHRRYCCNQSLWLQVTLKKSASHSLRKTEGILEEDPGILGN